MQQSESQAAFEKGNMSNPPEDDVMKRPSVVYKHTDCCLSGTLCPSNLICVTVPVRGDVCGGVLILPHS